MGKAFIGNFMGPTGPQGPQGPPGEIAAMPSIGSNGNWFIGERDTGVLADVDRALSAKIVASTEISEPGFIMDGKTASEKFAELNSNSISGIGKNIEGPNMTTYNFVKYANGLLEVWGDAVFDATTSTAQERIVEFPSVDFLSVDDMQVLLTANRNSTIITGLYESNGGGNITRTTHSFMARCTKTTGAYSIGFSFFVKGWWK